jgi:DNA-directed RNA polymerase specialized sigma24 family protein
MDADACLSLDLTDDYTIPNFTPLPPGINSQGDLHICLKSVPSPLPIQSYVASWEIIVALAALSIARKKRRKKRKASKEELLDDYFLDEKLKIRYGVGLDELLGNAGVISKSAEGIKIPLGIFNQKVSPAEALCKYLKENEEFKFSEIAEIINRDQRTVALNYRNAVKKKKEKMKIVKGELFISAKVFADRRLSVLESVVDHLKNKGLKNSEIAEILNKDSKNIWTLHSRAKKKLAKLNKNV